MGVSTEAFVAHPDEVWRFEGWPEPFTDVLKQLDPGQLAQLGQLLLEGSLQGTDDTYGALMRGMHDRMHSYSDEEWAIPVPEQLTIALAEVKNEQVPAIAEVWSQIEEFEADRKGAERGIEYIQELRAKAIVARDSGKQLFLWMSL